MMHGCITRASFWAYNSGMRLSAFGFLIISLAILAGCNKPADAPSVASADAQAAGTPPPAGGGDNTVAPMTTPVGGTTPVTGSVEGAGSGVGQSAKDMARRTATKSSGSSSLDQLGGGESGGQ